MAQIFYRLNRAQIGLALLGIVILSGCAVSDSSLGPLFEKINTIPPNTGVVYLYIPKVGTGPSDYWCYIKANGEIIASLRKEGYYPYFAKPGKIAFGGYWDDWSYGITSSATSIIKATFEVQAGHTYYVRIGTNTSVAHLDLYPELVAPDIAEKEIRDCKIMKSMILPSLQNF
jgi:hypothetical protein